jgi:[protein-PII] uridylyltransferase
MSMTAQRKDIDDPEVIQTFAEAVGDSTRLDYLYLLTVADIRATNPQRWNAWKDALLHQLYTKTRQALARGLDNPRTQDELIDGKKLEAIRLLRTSGESERDVLTLWGSLSGDYFLHSTPDEIAWQSRIVLESSPEMQPIVLVRPNRARGSSEIFICTSDRDNLFAITTQIIDQLGLNVMDARIQTARAACTMNSFLVLEEDGRPVDDERRRSEIIDTLADALRRSDKISPRVARRTPRQLRHFNIATEIEFALDTPHERTLMRLRTGDRPGLLSLVGYAFAECGIRLVSAKISTIGEQVEDIFIVCDRDTGEPLSPARHACLDLAIRSRLEQAA